MTGGYIRIDLLIADVPENYMVLGVSEFIIPTWNMRSENYFESLFAFAHSNLHGDAIIFIIHSTEP